MMGVVPIQGGAVGITKMGDFVVRTRTPEEDWAQKVQASLAREAARARAEAMASATRRLAASAKAARDALDEAEADGPGGRKASRRAGKP
jgi:UDP:flavonoid glycosyltransferase YjiC (YdhE family)